MPSSFEEIRQALIEFAYEPKAINLDALLADVIEIARPEAIQSLSSFGKVFALISMSWITAN